jgi:hypothetical protein
MHTNKLILNILIYLFALLAFDSSAQTSSSSASYNIKTVESNPIPRKAHFALWREVALAACGDSKKRFNLGQSECLEVISRRSETCIAKYESQAPAIIRTKAESRSIGRNFMYCATPYYFCNGVEVKTEAEVLAKCK